MTIEEASKQYEIPDYIREEYERLGLRGKTRDKAGSWECDRYDLEYLGLMVTLHQIGFERADVKTYMNLVFRGKCTKAERLKMLNRKRDKAMESIHFCEGQIDLLDYLRYELEK